MMFRILLDLKGVAIALIFALISLPVSATTHPVFDPSQEQAIERIVRNYLLKNPEVLLEALENLREQQRLAAAEQSRVQISARRDALENDPGSPVGGNPEGDVTIVEFFDYRCPYCKAVSPRLAELLDEDREIRFVYKEWPILGPVSVVAARAALAAWKQGKYDAFHEQLMSLDGQLSEGYIFKSAEVLGLDVNRLKRDMESAEIEEIIRRNQELADSLNINGTPAFVIGNVLIPGAVDMARLKALVEEARNDG